ncbi:unnamed protein product [Albugo candida]|uniref:ATP-dependent (S)-NAD(P)H-hydrate dehydratase n=1 Tax=Albugo candida TaxID=65357 RepID=A0A024GH89_9STRA|nr:unnamed protein product [Albugo candida]|eukprot:CCI46129.1 unnamed protein product [Albugo candida]
MHYNQLRSHIARLIPTLSGASRKGQHGKIGILGGSIEYTGAPYYAGISALRTGADLCHVFCAEEAAFSIKSYSPELIVHPFLRSDQILANETEPSRSESINLSVEKVMAVVPRLDVLVIGPGLGRDKSVRETLRQLLPQLRSAQMPLILDGDALYFISSEPDLIKGYTHLILTPNAATDPKKASEIDPAILSERLGNPIIVRKALADFISDGVTNLVIEEHSSPRRCGGQGDIMSGCIATFAAWAKNVESDGVMQGSPNPYLLAAYAGSLLTRMSSFQAYQASGRSMLATDVIECIGKMFSECFPSDSEQ